ncbi:MULTISPECIES: SusE domain-containing protein [unclassified Carboxylicivirga]|uniref:SusE domain-containing protein n=1 Tax=Carboxylicivirga TaxID=1628153 RepID=UPI003D3556B7
MRYLKFIYLFMFSMVLLNSCTEDVETPVLAPLEAPVLVSPDGALEYVLTEENAENPFETFIYSGAKFNMPIVSNYTIEVADLDDTEFVNKVDMQESTTLLFQSIDVKSFNLLFGLTGLDKAPGERATVNVRVRADNNNEDVAVMYSNVIQLNVTPYDAVVPPIYVVGDATAAGWSPADALPLESVSADEYKGTITLAAEPSSFRFLGQNTDWGPVQWFYDNMTLVESVPADLVGPAPVNEYGEINFIAKEAGDYEILFNKKNGTIKLTKQ